MAILIARYADAPELYDEIQKFWTSFHDLTNQKILFIFVDGERKYFDCSTNNFSNDFNDLNYSYPLDIIDSLDVEYFKLNNSNDNFQFKPIPNDNWMDRHTLSITETLNDLNIKHSQVPCLYVESLNGGFSHVYRWGDIKNKHRTLYSFFKRLTIAADKLPNNKLIINSQNISDEYKNDIRLKDTISSIEWIENQNNNKYIQIFNQIFNYPINISVAKCLIKTLDKQAFEVFNNLISSLIIENDELLMGHICCYHILRGWGDLDAPRLISRHIEKKPYIYWRIIYVRRFL